MFGHFKGNVVLISTGYGEISGLACFIFRFLRRPQDKLCLVLARDNGWACLSNDGPLREACKAQGVSVVWGLEIMLWLVQARHLDADKAIEVAEAIHLSNPLYITRKIITTFRHKVRQTSF